MLSILGYILIGGVIGIQGYYATESIFFKEQYNKRKTIERLYKCFETGKLYKENGTKKEFPYLLNAEIYKHKIILVFTVPKGIDPMDFNKKMYVFNQYLGHYIVMDVETSRIVLSVFFDGLPNEFRYQFDDIQTNHRLPIICGVNLEGHLYSYDMVNHPHLLISGETGSGKSSQIRSILSTLIKLKHPKDLTLILGDLKRSEFHLFKQIEHVKGVYHSSNELRPVLSKIKRTMTKRGNMLDEAGVNSIDELEKKIPYIVVCIDEVALLRKETDIMDILENISSVGRSLGVFIILSMQRPDSKLLDGKLKVNLTVRMGFRTADAINSNIIGTPGAENIKTPGRMVMKLNSDAQELQCPWLDNNKAKRLLATHKRKKDVYANPTKRNNGEYEKIMGLFQNE